MTDMLQISPEISSLVQKAGKGCLMVLNRPVQLYLICSCWSCNGFFSDFILL